MFSHKASVLAEWQKSISEHRMPQTRRDCVVLNAGLFLKGDKKKKTVINYHQLVLLCFVSLISPRHTLPATSAAPPPPQQASDQSRWPGNTHMAIWYDRDEAVIRGMVPDSALRCGSSSMTPLLLWARWRNRFNLQVPRPVPLWSRADGRGRRWCHGSGALIVRYCEAGWFVCYGCEPPPDYVWGVHRGLYK